MGTKQEKNSIRLDKFLADAGAGTRSQVKKLICQGRVRINGEYVKKPESKLDLSSDRVELDGEPVQTEAAFVYYLLNKPAGYISATEDPREKTVLELVPRAGRRKLFPVGRLDKDTEGLLLITDDGELAHQLLSPKKHVDKTYYARISGEMTPEDIRIFEEGVDIGEDKLTLPARLEILQAGDGQSEILLTICEGKFHQVKRMVEAVGKKVTYLKRISMGGLTLPEDLKTGECRLLTPEELQKL